MEETTLLVGVSVAQLCGYIRPPPVVSAVQVIMLLNKFIFE
jgi:hypothetical protein